MLTASYAATTKPGITQAMNRDTTTINSMEVTSSTMHILASSLAPKVGTGRSTN